jgi:hypothetical protein
MNTVNKNLGHLEKSKIGFLLLRKHRDWGAWRSSPPQFIEVFA